MENKTKRFLSLVFAIVMVFSMLPQITFGASAEETGAYVQTTSIAVGDTVVLACKDKNAELGTVSTNGASVAFANAPTGVNVLTVEAGYTDGTYAFKTSDGKYLYWSSGNSLATNAQISQNSSWKVTIGNDGNAVITNAKDSSRKLQYNASNPRFACYTSAQTAVQFYKFDPNAATEACAHPAHNPDGTCKSCPEIVSHTYVDGRCSCGLPETIETYTEATSIAVGDTVIIVYKDGKMELSGIDTSSNIGTGAAYTSAPFGLYPLTVEAGATAGTYAFKDINNKHLSLNANDNKLTVTTNAVDAKSSWNVTYTNEGVTIANANWSNRQIQWNKNSGQERFACYAGTQQAVQLYKIEAAAPECEHEYEFACSTECNKCGKGEREATHAYEYDCSTTCKYCYETTRPEAEHKYEFPCSTKCYLCGAGEREPEVTHEYVYDCSTKCNRCGEERDEVTHTYEYDCSTKCKVCHDTTRPDAKHTYTNGTCECGEQCKHNFVNGACDICGAEAASPKVALWGNLTNFNDLSMQGDSGTTVSCVIDLPVGTYKFKIKEDGAYMGNNSSFTDTATGLVMSSSAGDCTIDVSGGTYTFTYDFETNTLSVTKDASGDGTLVSPITLNIADGSISITDAGFTQGNNQQAYTGSYILTGTATAEQYYNISISGVADGATITLKDLDIASNGSNPLAFTGAVTVTATGTIKLDYAYGGALTSSADSKVTILGDADIIASAPYGAISNSQWDITCNSLTLESTTSPAVYVSELTVCADEDIKVTSTGGNAINCTNGGQGNATLTAGGDITLIGNNAYTVNAKEVALDAAGDITVTSNNSYAVSVQEVSLTAAGDITVTTSGSSTPAIDADKVSMTSTAGSISATNDSFMVFRQYTSLTLAANNNITVTGNGSSPAVSAPELSMTATNGDISVTSSGGMAIGANTSATLVAGGDITATGNSQSPAVSASELSMTATNGDISVTSSGGMAISANTSATLVAGGDITATGNGSAPAVYAAEASVTAGNLKIENKGTGMAVAGVLEANAENITMATQGAALYSQTPALNYTAKLTEITSAGTIVTCKHPSYQDGICTGCGAPAAAMIGDKAFDSLQAALDAAKSGDTVKLMDDIKLSQYADIKTANNGETERSITLDLNGRSITRADDYNSYPVYPLIFVGLNQTLTIVGEGTISAPSGATIGVYGTLNLNGGTVINEGTTEDDMAIHIYGWTGDENYPAAAAGTGTISGGTIKGDVFVEAATKEDKIAVGALTISGGVFENDLIVSGEAKVSDGTFNGDVIVEENDEASLTIIGGEFTNGVPEDYLHPDYKLNDEGEIVEKVYVAKIGDQGYESLQAAMNAAKDGDTIVLLASVNTFPVINKAVTFKGGAEGVAINYALNQNFTNIAGTVTFENLTFNKPLFTEHGGAKPNLTIVFEGCTFNVSAEAGYGILIGTSYSNSVVKGLTINNCNFKYVGDTFKSGYMLYVQCVKEVTITNNVIDGNNLYRGAIHLGDSTDYATVATVANNTIKNFCRGVMMGNRVEGSQITIEENSFENISYKPGETKAEFECAPIFIHSNASADTTKVSVTDNVVVGCQNSMIYSEDQDPIEEYVTDFTGNKEKADANAEEVELILASSANTPNAPAPVATIGTARFYSLQEAVDAAKNGESVILLADLELTSHVEVPAGVTLTAAEGVEIILKEHGTIVANGTVDMAITTAEGDYVDYSNGVYSVVDAALNAANMTLGDSFSLNFWVKTEDLRDGVENYKAVMTIPGTNKRTVEIPGSQWKTVAWGGITYYQIPFAGLSAKEMNVEVEFQIFNGDKAESGKFTESLRKNAEDLLKDPKQSDGLKAVLVDMLNYGAAAQKEFGYNTGNLANSGLTAEQQDLATKSYDLPNAWNGGSIGYGSNLELKNEIILHIWYKAAGVKTVKIDGVEVGPEKITPRIGNSIMSVAVTDLAVADGFDTVTVEFFDASGNSLGTVTESVASYLKYMLSKSDDTNGLYDATAKFITSSYNYFK